MSSIDPAPLTPERAAILAQLKRAIDEAFNDDRPTIPAEEVFAQLRAHHAERMRADRSKG